VTSPGRAAAALTVALVAAAALVAESSMAAPPPADPESRALEAAAAARAAGDLEAAIATLKQAWDDLPHSEAIVMALAQAYLADENPTWAVRVLSEHLDYHEGACDPRLLLAWVHVEAGMPELAHAVLDGAACDQPPEIRARRELVLAELARLEDRDAEARARLREVRRSPRIYAEDRAWLGELTRALDPPRASPIATGRVELATGWTSNGLSGSPVDATTPESVGSALGVADLRLRLAARRPLAARPMVEGRLHAQELWAEEARDLSFETGTLRTGVLLGDGASETLVAFSTDATRLAGGDRYQEGPLWFSEAQRVEIELGVGDAFALFAGSGRRRFRDAARTRSEGELSAGWVTTGPLGVLAIGGLSFRAHDAENDAYDLVGTSAVTQAYLPVWRGFELSATVATSADAYPRSEGYFAGAQGSARRDLVLRVGAGMWTPRRRPVRGGLTVEHTSRTSSAEAYDYADARALLRLEWRFDSDTLGRRAIGADGRTPLEHGPLAEGGDDDLGDVRELMQKDDAAQRGASCLR